MGLYLPSALVSIGQGMLAPITPALAGAFDVSLGLAAQVLGANLLGRLILMIPSGYLVDRYGSRFAMRLGPALIVGCSVVTFLTPSFGLLCGVQTKPSITARCASTWPICDASSHLTGWRLRS